MKIRMFLECETFKGNDYIVKSKNGMKLVISVDKQQIKNIILHNIRDSTIDEIIKEQSDVLSSILDDEIEYVISCFLKIYCDESDDLKQIRKKMYRFNTIFEKLIALLMSKDVNRRLLELKNK